MTLIFGTLERDMKSKMGIRFKIVDQRGASSVEFAIVLPLLAIFLFGIIEFSILFYDKAVITNASREGARYGILYTPDPRMPIVKTGSRDGIETKVNYYAKEHLISFGGPTDPVIKVDLLKEDGTFVENSPCTMADDTLIVTVTYHYDFLIVPDMLAAFFAGEGTNPSGYDIHAITRMRCE
jgi:hypothetical protein